MRGLHNFGLVPSCLQGTVWKPRRLSSESIEFANEWKFRSGMTTTIDRRFRQLQYDILYLFREYFLTTFPQTPILRIQTRGIAFRFFLRPQPRKASEPSRVQPENQSERFLSNNAPRLRSALGRAFLFFFTSEPSSPFTEAAVARLVPSGVLVLTRLDFEFPGPPALGVKWMCIPARALGTNWAE